jgi:hypothetical protein
MIYVLFLVLKGYFHQKFFIKIRDKGGRKNEKAWNHFFNDAFDSVFCGM